MGNDTKITFEEIMFTAIEAAQDTFQAYMNLEIFAGKVDKKVEPIESDVLGVVGIAGQRVGYIIIAMDKLSAKVVAERFLMMENPDTTMIRDAVGELSNTIAGAFKTKYHEQYGGVALGLPLIISGKLIPVLESSQAGEKDKDGAVKFQSSGVVIPFRAQDGDTNLKLSLIIYLQ